MTRSFRTTSVSPPTLAAFPPPPIFSRASSTRLPGWRSHKQIPFDLNREVCTFPLFRVFPPSGRWRLKERCLVPLLASIYPSCLFVNSLAEFPLFAPPNGVNVEGEVVLLGRRGSYRMSFLRFEVFSFLTEQFCSVRISPRFRAPGTSLFSLQRSPES